MRYEPKRARRARGVSTRAFVLLLALMLVVGAAIGGTVAWLTSTTGAVTNTFTYGDINIDLTELTGNNYKFVPGCEISKDPKVTVKKDSEACWLFVKIEEKNSWPDEATYELADGWTALDATNHPGVYYRGVPAATADTDFYVLKDNKITVSNTLTKEKINSLTGDAKTPKLVFTAYAIQMDGIPDAATAWERVNEN